MASPPMVGVGLVCELLSPGESNRLRRSAILITQKPLTSERKRQIAGKTRRLKTPHPSSLQDNAAISILIPSSNEIGSYPKSSLAIA